MKFVALLSRRHFEALLTANARTGTRVTHTRHRQTRTITSVVTFEEIALGLVGNHLARKAVGLAAADTTNTRLVITGGEHSFSEEHTAALVALARAGHTHRTAAVGQAAGAVVGTHIEKLVVFKTALFSVRRLFRGL